MKLSVIVPTHNRPSLLHFLLESLSLVDCENIDFDVHLVGNTPEDHESLLALKKSFPNIKIDVSITGRLGVNRARNLGIKKASGEILLLLDDDCSLVSNNYFKNLLEAHKKYPEVLAIGGIYCDIPQANFFDTAYNIVTRDWQEPLHFDQLESSRLIGGHVSYKKDLLGQTGQGFDESILYGGSETEFHERLSRRGCSLLLLNYLQVGHCGNITQSQLIRKAFFQARGYQSVEERRPEFYQRKRSALWALHQSSSEEAYEGICYGLELYDQSFKRSQRFLDLGLEEIQTQVLNAVEMRGGFV